MGTSKGLNYVQYIGQNLVVGDSFDIRTFVIGFTAVSSEVSRASSIAESACTNTVNPNRTGSHYEAGSAIELERDLAYLWTLLIFGEGGSGSAIK